MIISGSCVVWKADKDGFVMILTKRRGHKCCSTIRFVREQKVHLSLLAFKLHTFVFDPTSHTQRKVLLCSCNNIVANLKISYAVLNVFVVHRGNISFMSKLRTNLINKIPFSLYCKLKFSTFSQCFRLAMIELF